MVKFILRGGRKSERDTMVFLVAKDEVLTFHELLFILKHYFDSEHDYYPVSDGFLGKAMLVAAINGVALDVPIPTVLKRFNLPFKQLEIVDQRNRYKERHIAISEKTNLAELM